LIQRQTGRLTVDRNITVQFSYGTVIRRQFEEWEIGMRWPPACEYVIPEAEERPLLEDVTKQCSEDRD
jgi:hypothetical protein